MKLSIIIPVFNEEKTIGEILKRVIAVDLGKVDKEIVIVDDGSTDATASEIKNQSASWRTKVKNVKVLIHRKNQGKGAAVLTGIKASAGDYIIIQDADLEYDPLDIGKLLVPILEKRARVVYGTRLNRLPNFTKDEKEFLFLIHYLGNRFLSLIASVLYGQWITDIETCYKLFPKKAVDRIRLNAKGFDFESEITAKLLRQGYRILELSIKTKPRGYQNGKKLNTVRDGSSALWTLIKYRL